MANCVRLSGIDNVATVVVAVAAGETLSVGDGPDIAAREEIPVYHKAALEDIPEGGLVRKYGQTIGVARAAIAAGSHVHTHNLVSEADYSGASR